MTTKNAYKIIISLWFVLGSLHSCSAQEQIIPVEKHIKYIREEIDIPNGAYFKDVNCLLDKYIGIWKGNYPSNGYNYEFQVKKIKDKFLNIAVDELVIRYKITNSQGKEIASTFSLPNESPFVIVGEYLSETKTYYTLYYVGFNANCGQNGTVYIEVLKDGTMKLYLYPDGDTLNCDYTEQVLPTKPIILKKQ